MDRSSARLRYAQHKKNAAKRGVEFELSFEEWWAIWEPHWERRGTHKDQLGMCRTHDKGPYRVGNVRLDSPKGNAAERGMMQKCSRSYLYATGPVSKDLGSYHSYASEFMRPDQALELQQQEYEWIPGE